MRETVLSVILSQLVTKLYRFVVHLQLQSKKKKPHGNIINN